MFVTVPDLFCSECGAKVATEWLKDSPTIKCACIGCNHFYYLPVANLQSYQSFPRKLVKEEPKLVETCRWKEWQGCNQGAKPGRLFCAYHEQVVREHYTDANLVDEANALDEEESENLAVCKWAGCWKACDADQLFCDEHRRYVVNHFTAVRGSL